MIILDILFSILALLIGGIDEYKWFIQYSKLTKTRSVRGISKRMLIISFTSKSFVLLYALYSRNLTFVLLYLLGAIGSYLCLKTVYRLSYIENKSLLNFLKYSFYIKEDRNDSKQQQRRKRKHNR